ncbi:MAG: energy transducer TonB [Hyphomonadaceae bacterium]|nr:energy transducer TonB [Hyphomonadaceae bacterium]
MYYATKRSNNTTRVVGLTAVVVINALVFWALASGFGAAMVKEFTETQVAIIDVPEIEEDEPPPPPPVDVELPPPPPSVILPDFVFDQAPSENAIAQVTITKDPPRPAEVRPPPPKVVMSARPKAGRRFEKPEYPAASIRAKEAGEVVVSVCVDEQGRMSNVQVVKSSGFPRLDEATVKGLPKTRLDPAKGSDGKPMAMCSPPHTFTLVWNLEEAK